MCAVTVPLKNSFLLERISKTVRTQPSLPNPSKAPDSYNCFAKSSKSIIKLLPQ